MSADRKSAPPPKPVRPSIRITKIVPSPSVPPPPSLRRRPVRVGAESLSATMRRAPVRILLRPQVHGSIGPSLNGDAVIPVGPASAETWGTVWRPGDEEAIVWVLAPRVNDALNALREDPRIVDVRVSMKDVG